MSDCCANPNIKKKKKPTYLERIILKIIAIFIVVGILIFAGLFWVTLLIAAALFFTVFFGYYFIGKLKKRKR